jgi:hypothetical protein
MTRLNWFRFVFEMIGCKHWISDKIFIMGFLWSLVVMNSTLLQKALFILYFGEGIVE